MAVEHYAPASIAGRSVLAPGLLLATVILIGLNLRPFLTAIGPLVPAIQQTSHLGYQGIAALTFLPMLVMGLGAFLAPSVRRHAGAHTALPLALVVLAAGCALRLQDGGLVLIISAAICGLGAAIVQSLLPGVIKHAFPTRMAPVMGMYSAALMAGGALGAQFAPLLVAPLGGWQGSLAFWAIPALLAALLSWRVFASHGHAQGKAMSSLGLLSIPRTWLLMACLGVMNGGYGSLVAWLAPFYQARGWSATQTGSLFALMALAQAASAITLPALAARTQDRRPWLWLTLVLQAVGFAGFALWPDAAPRLWTIISGAGLGGCFALCLIVTLDHLSDAADAGALGAVVQGGGFIISALAPWATGGLRDLSGGFVAGWFAHLAGVIIVMLLVARLAPRGYAKAMGRRPG